MYHKNVTFQKYKKMLYRNIFLMKTDEKFICFFIFLSM